MYLSKLSLALCALIATSNALGSSSKPVCVTKCWDNSQYVSQCAGDVKCLCEDSEFQNAVYQCLYSQCQTAQFGSALHHTISFCQEEKAHPHEKEVKQEPVKPTIPALIRQQNSPDKRQNKPMMSNSVSVTRSVTQSVTRSVTKKPMSMSASQYMTYSSQRAMHTMVTQIADGQIQAPSPGPYPGVTQIADGQIQAPSPAPAVTPVSQIGDGQVQAPSPVSPVQQIPDGQVQATAYAALKRAFYDNRKQGHEI